MTNSTSIVEVDTQSDSHSLERHEDSIIRRAITILEQRLFDRDPALGSPAAVKPYLRLKLTAEEDEVFAVLFLDAGHRILAFEVIFHGTIDQACVYPRPVIKRVLFHNAAAVILAHNNPSGRCQPSEADHTLTRRLNAALALMDVRVLDHIIVGQGEPFSFAEAGLL
jgi:DNA repair protein RadC